MRRSYRPTLSTPSNMISHRDTQELIDSIVGDSEITEAVITELAGMGRAVAEELGLPAKLQTYMQKRGLVMLYLGGPYIRARQPADVSVMESADREPEEEAQGFKVNDIVRFHTQPDGRGVARLGVGKFLGIQDDPDMGKVWVVMMQDARLVKLTADDRMELYFKG